MSHPHPCGSTRSIGGDCRIDNGVHRAQALRRCLSAVRRTYLAVLASIDADFWDLARDDTCLKLLDFMQGFLTNALNPKVALFFLAFVPQFISTDSTQQTMAFFFLGLVFNLNGTLWNLLVAWITAKAGVRLRSSGLAAWMNRCIGTFFVFLGVKLALAKAT
jgi:threonine/homoserine/homoserine lactone efflux protein